MSRLTQTTFMNLVKVSDYMSSIGFMLILMSAIFDTTILAKFGVICLLISFIVYRILSNDVKSLTEKENKHG